MNLNEDIPSTEDVLAIAESAVDGCRASEQACRDIIAGFARSPGVPVECLAEVVQTIVMQRERYIAGSN